MLTLIKPAGRLTSPLGRARCWRLLVVTSHLEEVFHLGTATAMFHSSSGSARSAPAARLPLSDESASLPWTSSQTGRARQQVVQVFIFMKFGPLACFCNLSANSYSTVESDSQGFLFITDKIFSSRQKSLVCPPVAWMATCSPAASQNKTCWLMLSRRDATV